jgi:cellobiose-specific phosphotransferase system component IIB
VIVQGPPGTGKSFLISEIIYSLQAQGSRVCVAAQTNKTVSELCRTTKMTRLLESGKVYKNSIKSNEAAEYPNLKSGNDHFVAPGDVLLSTFFSLKERISALGQNDTQEFDIVIIEEASQANLALISALYRLAPRTLLVGDPMQMAPIVLESRMLYEQEPKYKDFSAGLSAVASNTKTDSCLLTDSYRLNAKGASQTGIFYDGKLVSMVSDFNPLKFSEKFQRYFDPEGGAVVSCEFELEQDSGVDASLDAISRIIDDVMKHNTGIKIALLSPYIRVVTQAQSKLSHLIGSEQILVETIDRIQGITVDFTIVLLPLTNPLFATELERFNVATSRARCGNLIFISPQYRWLSINEKVKRFIESSMTNN